MESSRLVLVIFLLLFVFLSPNSHTPSLSQQRELERDIEDERVYLGILNASSYGDFDHSSNKWLNITGLLPGSGYAWDFLPKVQERAREQLNTIIDASEFSNSVPNITTQRNVPDIRDVTGDIDGGDALSSIEPVDPPFPIYQNVTSSLHGKWVRSPLDEEMRFPTLNLTAVAPSVPYTSGKYNRNITGRTGNLHLNLYEFDGGNSLRNPHLVRDIKAQMTIKDETSNGDGWELTLFGVHYPRQGGILLSTTSEKFAGIFALPHFALSQNAFLLAQELLNQTLLSTIKEQEADLTSPANSWTSLPNSPSEAMFPVPHCEFLVYLQQHSLDDTTLDLKTLEHELRFPTGASMPTAPPIRMSALTFSPDCGFVLESQGPPEYSPGEGLHLTGQKEELYMRAARRCILFFAVEICAQIFLLMRQIKDASTPSTRSRISFYTIGIMALGDGLACMVFMFVSMYVESAFLPLIASAFLSFLCVSFFGMKFLMEIWSVQAPERQERERGRQSERDRRTAAVPAPPAVTPAPPNLTPALVPVVTAVRADSLPLPVTASRPANPPIIITPDQDLDAAEAEDNAATQPTPQTTLGSARREMSALYIRFYLVLLGILFLSLHATTWPTTLRTAYSNLFCFLYLSFWLPQIHRNIIRNCHKALRWEFVLGQSILRLLPILYFYTIPSNILFIEPDLNAAYILTGWLWLQICVLIAQEILSPRFFVPNGWAPPAYDYHPILREDDDEEAGATMPIGFTQATAASPTSPKPGESREKGKKVFDCAICTENIEVSVVPRARTGEGEGVAAAGAGVAATTMFARRAYMVTPCRHIFHSGCLEGWMRYRLQCPICRENMPPV